MMDTGALERFRKIWAQQSKLVAQVKALNAEHRAARSELEASRRELEEVHGHHRLGEAADTQLEAAQQRVERAERDLTGYDAAARELRKRIERLGHELGPELERFRAEVEISAERLRAELLSRAESFEVEVLELVGDLQTPRGGSYLAELRQAVPLAFGLKLALAAATAAGIRSTTMVRLRDGTEVPIDHPLAQAQTRREREEARPPEPPPLPTSQRGVV